MINSLRLLFHLLCVRPFVLIVLGMNVRHRERLPREGPAIIIANHNNHVDTFVLMTQFPKRQLLRIRAAAAADYFLSNRLLAWISLNMFGIIPVKRGDLLRGDGDPLAGCSQALVRGEILIIYPEGTRGEAERMTNFKTGFAHLARRHPNVPVISVFLHGLGKFLPRRSFVPVPFICYVDVGWPLFWNGNCLRMVQCAQTQMSRLASTGTFPDWK